LLRLMEIGRFGGVWGPAERVIGVSDALEAKGL
jgi:hypothetical protein